MLPGVELSAHSLPGVIAHQLLGEINSVSFRPHLYLASQSPRRRELLAQIGVNHAVLSVTVTEQPRAQESAQAYVQRLALEKACAGVLRLSTESLAPAPVMGADTIVVCKGNILEKPRDQAHAAAMLGQLSGQTHQVMTAVAVADEARREVMLSTTEVSFRQLSDAEIAAYWHTGEPQDKAGGYAIQGLAAVFVRELRGSYTGVVGLPLEATIELLQSFGVPWWQSLEGQPHE